MFYGVKSSVPRLIGCLSAEEHNDFEKDKSYLLKCDDHCSDRNVWGCPRSNGVVTHDSTICTVAKMLAIPLGIEFTMVMTGAQDSFSSCHLNGFTSEAVEGWNFTYRIEFSRGKWSQYKEKVH